MGDYNRTIWKDHIKDQNGNVIQQGTPVSAKNLNNMENQIVVLNAKENILAELVKESTPSGFTTLSDLDFTTMSTTPNTIKLLKDSVAYVNGYKVTIPAGTTITLDTPPTSGAREDLVFLEVWKQADANGAEQLNWRIRVVDGVDFSYIDGMVTSTGTVGNCIGNNYNVTAQGANLSPIAPNNTNINRSYFRKPFVNSPFVSDDVGMYVAGAGDSASKTALGTTDGFVYAIPMFRVKRRNSGGYGVNNGNGSNNFKVYYSSMINIPPYADTTIALVDSTGLNVGDYLDKVISSSNIVRRALKVKSINGNSIVVTNLSSTNLYVDGNQYILKSTGRNDLLFADIIVDRDITDLRHQVSLTGFNFQQLLEENFDKLSRGELQTNAKTSMLKTYHGLAKTPIDANTVFYASMDGTTVAEVGGALAANSPTFQLALTGLGITSAFSSDITGYDVNVGTIDLMANFDNAFVSGSQVYLLHAYNVANSKTALLVYTVNGALYLAAGSQSITNGIQASIANPNLKGYHHVRVRWNATNMYLYIDGVLKITIASGASDRYVATKLYNSQTNGTSYIMKGLCDISISNIDRGAVFATLPQDVIDGYARIAPAFNTQRNIFSDALISEAPLAQVKCAGGNNKEIALGDSTDWIKDDGTKWNTGDRIKVKGLGGEIITGVIDSDTALCRTIEFKNHPVTSIRVDDVSKLSVGDTLALYDTNLSSGGTLTISSIDTTTNTVTFSGAMGTSGSWDINPGYMLFETSASSSAPTVKANITGTAQAGAATTITLAATSINTDDYVNGLTITITGGTGAGQVRTISDYVGSTKVATVSTAWTTNPDATSTYMITGVPIAGTWSGLGTNEATFTLGTIYALTNQDLWINYSLNEVAGQGGISEVLTATLAGESNGKKLVVNPTVHVRDDMAGKIAGSVVENPNVGKVGYGAVLISPSNFTNENSQSGGYDKIKSLDGNNAGPTTATSGLSAQQLFSYNVIRILEDKYGKLPCPDDTASKVAWLKANLSLIRVNAWVYGSCPSGNLARTLLWSDKEQKWSNTWTSGYTKNNNAPAPSLISMELNTTSATSSKYYDLIDSNGFVHFLAYTDASDGVTASTIYTDYVNIEVVLNTPAGYDVLAPENPRRDDGKGNILLVRKETKEIQTMFSRANTDGIITYGDYVPYQGTGISIVDGQFSYLAKNKNFISDIGSGGSKNGITNTILERQFPANVDKGYQFKSSNLGYFKLEELNNLMSSNNDLSNAMTMILRNVTGYLGGGTKVSRGILPGQGATRNVDISSIISRFNLPVLSYVAIGILVKYQSNIYLIILRSDVNSDKTVWFGNSSPNSAYDIFYLLNRPLIK